MIADDLLKTEEGQLLWRESPLYHKLHQTLLACRAEDRNAIVADVIALLVLKNIELVKEKTAAWARNPVVLHVVQDTAVVHKDGKENLHV